MKELLHRYLWQSLPRSWRRAALFNAASIMSPRVSEGAKPADPLIVAGTLRTASGLGESARLCHNALEKAGVAVYGIDLSEALMQPRDYHPFSFHDGRDVEGRGTLIVHVNSPLVPLALWHLGRRFLRDKYVVGCWAWELPEVPADWRHGIPFVHEIWVPSRFTADAVRPIAEGRPVHVMPYAVAANGRSQPVDARVSQRPFTVLTIFNTASSIARKNPSAAIAAFRRAFGDDPTVRLIVKTANGETYSEGLEPIRTAAEAPNIVLIDRVMDEVELDRLYYQADVRTVSSSIGRLRFDNRRGDDPRNSRGCDQMVRQCGLRHRRERSSGAV